MSNGSSSSSSDDDDDDGNVRHDYYTERSDSSQYSSTSDESDSSQDEDTVFSKKNYKKQLSERLMNGRLPRNRRVAKPKKTDCLKEVYLECKQAYSLITTTDIADPKAHVKEVESVARSLHQTRRWLEGPDSYHPRKTPSSLKQVNMMLRRLQTQWLPLQQTTQQLLRPQQPKPVARGQQEGLQCLLQQENHRAPRLIDGTHQLPLPPNVPVPEPAPLQPQAVLPEGALPLHRRLLPDPQN